MIDKPDFGRGDLMAVASVRYCLGRSTYIVSDCVEWLLRNWHHIEPNTKFVINRDVEEAFLRNDVGMDCDRREWEKVRALWAISPSP